MVPLPTKQKYSIAFHKKESKMLCSARNTNIHEKQPPSDAQACESIYASTYGKWLETRYKNRKKGSNLAQYIIIVECVRTINTKRYFEFHIRFGQVRKYEGKNLLV